MSSDLTQLSLAQAASSLQRGQALLAPVDTLWGLAALPSSQGLLALRHLKKRGPHKPFLLLGSKAAKCESLGLALCGLPQTPATTWLVSIQNCRLAPALLQMLQEANATHLAIRTSTHPNVIALSDALLKQGESGWLLSSSANLQGGKPAMNQAEALLWFKHESQHIAGYWPGVSEPSGEASQIIDLLSGQRHR